MPLGSPHHMQCCHHLYYHPDVESDGNTEVITFSIANDLTPAFIFFTRCHLPDGPLLLQVCSEIGSCSVLLGGNQISCCSSDKVGAETLRMTFGLSQTKD